MAKVLAIVTGSISFSQRGEKGEKGDNGVGVKGFNTYYGLSSSKSSPPTTYSYDTLSETIISQNSEKYVWSADKVLYTDGTGDDFINAYCIGKCSDLTSVKEQYGTSTSAGTKPSSWGYSYPSNPANGTYVWSRDEIVWAGDNSTTHSDAQLIGYIAVNGATGNGIKSTEVTYQIGSSGTTPPQGTWSTSVPNITDANPYLWTRTIFKYTNGSSSNPSYSVATRGTKGALMREHDGFESGSYKYLSGSGAEAYIDVVCINRKWYQCTSTYTSSSPNVTDGHWSLMNNYTSIATHLLLAENATINMLGSNQINLYTPSNGAMFGSFRVVEDVNDWSLWLGGKDGNSASFAVTRGGAIKATAGTIGSFIIKGSQGGYYELYANYGGVINFSAPSSISLNSRGISVSTGVPGNGAQFFFGNTEDTEGTPSWTNGALRIMLNTPKGANTDQSAAYISVIGTSGYTAKALELSAMGGTKSHAIAINNGDVAGLRPSFANIASNYTLTEYDHTIECCNSSVITITLPYSPKYGQCYTVIQRGGRVIFSSSKGIYDARSTVTGTTWNSDSRGQVSWIWYNGSQWIVSYVVS
jgi:hypothetical protein